MRIPLNGARAGATATASRVIVQRVEPVKSRLIVGALGGTQGKTPRRPQPQCMRSVQTRRAFGIELPILQEMLLVVLCCCHAIGKLDYRYDIENVGDMQSSQVTL